MTIVFIGLGSNMNSPRQQITTAIQSLGKLQSTQMISASSFYESKPVGPQDQDDYINAVVKLETDLNPTDLLDCLQAIEHGQGRERRQHWGPRTLDLDILLFGDQIIHNKRLTIPHIEMCNRPFVLVPLTEIEPDCFIPEKGLVTDLVAKLDQSGLKVMP